MNNQTIGYTRLEPNVRIIYHNMDIELDFLLKELEKIGQRELNDIKKYKEIINDAKLKFYIISYNLLTS